MTTLKSGGLWDGTGTISWNLVVWKWPRRTFVRVSDIWPKNCCANICYFRSQISPWRSQFWTFLLDRIPLFIMQNFVFRWVPLGGFLKSWQILALIFERFNSYIVQSSGCKWKQNHVCRCLSLGLMIMMILFTISWQVGPGPAYVLSVSQFNDKLSTLGKSLAYNNQNHNHSGMKFTTK